MATEPDTKVVEELLLQALETELGGVQVYETAIRCAVNDELREEWEEYLEQTREHVEIVTRLCEEFGIDTGRETPGRLGVRMHGETHVRCMEDALSAGDPALAEIVAAECVVLAEVKDHANWELLGELADVFPGEEATAIQEAVDEVEEQEDEHLYHTKGWARELWIQALGMPAVLPPPEEAKDVKSAIGAARAKSERKRMIKRKA
jgi:rubrerythrin